MLGAVVAGLTEEDVVPRTEILIELEDQIVEAILRRIESAGSEVVRLSVIRTRRFRVGQWVVVDDLSGNRIDAIFGNDVAWKRIARPDAVDVTAGVGIVNGDLAAPPVGEAGKIAVAHL